MKTSRSSLVGVLALVTVGCASAPPVMLDPVGPGPKIKGTDTGILKVYTPTEELSSDGPVFFTGYRIYASNGSLFKEVSANGSINVANDEPNAVELPEGSYIVEAATEKSSAVKVPVVIKDGRVTAVHLQRDSSRTLPQDDASKLVMLPDGQAVGWRAGKNPSR